MSDPGRYTITLAHQGGVVYRDVEIVDGRIVRAWKDGDEVELADDFRSAVEGMLAVHEQQHAGTPLSFRAEPVAVPR